MSCHCMTAEQKRSTRALNTNNSKQEKNFVIILTKYRYMRILNLAYLSVGFQFLLLEKGSKCMSILLLVECISIFIIFLNLSIYQLYFKLFLLKYLFVYTMVRCSCCPCKNDETLLEAETVAFMHPLQIAMANRVPSDAVQVFGGTGF